MILHEMSLGGVKNVFKNHVVKNIRHVVKNTSHIF